MKKDMTCGECGLGPDECKRAAHEQQLAKSGVGGGMYSVPIMDCTGARVLRARLAAAEVRLRAPLTDAEVRQLWVYAWDIGAPSPENLQSIRDTVTRFLELRDAGDTEVTRP